MGKTRLALALGVAAVVAGGWGFPSERVAFRNGTTAAVRGRLIGPHLAACDYIVTARAGQTLQVELLTDATEIYYSVTPAGADKTMINTSVTGDRKWSAPVPADGDYSVRVFLLRRAARAGATASFKLRFALDPR